MNYGNEYYESDSYIYPTTMDKVGGPIRIGDYDTFWVTATDRCPYTYAFIVTYANQAPDTFLYLVCTDSNIRYKGYSWGPEVAQLIVNEYLSTLPSPTPSPTPTPQPGGLSINIPGCPLNVTSGVGITLPFTISGGTSPYTLKMYLDNVLQQTFTGVTCTSCQLNGLTFTGSGTHIFRLDVTDSASGSARSNDCTVNIGTGGTPTPQPGGVTVNIPNCPIEVTQGVRKDVPFTISGGTAPYTIKLYQDNIFQTSWTDSCNNCVLNIYPSTITGSHVLRLDVTDSAYRSGSSNNCTVNYSGGGTPTPQPGGLSINIPGCPLNVTSGVGITLPFTISGGTSPYTLKMYLDNVLQQTFTGVTCTSCQLNGLTFTGSGTHIFRLDVTDSASGSARSNDCTVNIGGGGGGAGYNCVSGTCQYVSSGAQYPDLTSCQNVCGGGGTPTPQPQYHNLCINNVCTRVSGAGIDECSNVGGSCGGGGGGGGCPGCNLSTSICFAGTCIRKTDLMIGGAAFVGILLLTR